MPFTELTGASYFNCADAHAIIRGGHLDSCVPWRPRPQPLGESAVVFGQGRQCQENDRWLLFRSHYGFDAFYCQPGIAGAHEKGGVEGEVGWFRRSRLSPVPGRLRIRGRSSPTSPQSPDFSLARSGQNGPPRPVKPGSSLTPCADGTRLIP